MSDIKEQIRAITDNILADYRKGRYIDRPDTFNQPDKAVVEDIIGKVQKLIFPGFFKAQTYRYYTRDNSTSTLVEDILFNLTRQIALTLRYRKEYERQEACFLTSRAQEISLKFLSGIPRIRALIETDLEAEFEGDPAAENKDDIIFSYPGLYAIMVYRIAHELVLLDVPMIPRMMTESAHTLTGIDINPGATIGRYFFIDHGTGIVIGETTEIGENVKIYQGVTLGALSTRKGQLLHGVKRHPTIEDNVTIYSGASILGGETRIGRGAVIGANAFITSSVPAGAKVSIKNQEYSVRFDGEAQVESRELDQEKNWFYVI
ncbi:serine O-acetyltransferase EpsC [Chordicoccus furentiruminis]|uniref:serine O-acetyltransferase EpsC n=1 Tax=Chordicoccus furentiruminis TaxID=2709410 RepID=UPI0023A81F31|nr:serine O-acetyltransferase EpsC [Chordicoccus furentiruminis]